MCNRTKIIQRTIVVVSIGILIFYLKKNRCRRRVCGRRFSVLDKIPSQIQNLRDLVEVSDNDCKDQLRMDRATFHKLCHLLQLVGGLSSSRNVRAAEKVAMFLSILAHHTKNRCVKFQFKRSGQTVLKHFHAVLRCVLRLHNVFLVTPQPIPDDCTDERWGKFKGCLGALDGTYVDVHVPTVDKERYRNRKRWEGSAADSRVLRDAINRTNGLKVPRGTYYLCDNGYLNCDGFLTPYKGVRYHLSKLISRRPQNPQELQIDVDPLDGGLDEYMSTEGNDDGANNVDIVETLDTTPEWTAWRDNLAHNMWNDRTNNNGGNE
ncbi:hypothetical protein ACS0TY_014152 [Phlomoides rotata]